MSDENQQNFGIDFLGRSSDDELDYNCSRDDPLQFTGCGNMPNPQMMIATNTHYVPAPEDIYIILWGLQLPRVVITLGDDFLCDAVGKEKKKKRKKEHKRRGFLGLFKCCLGRQRAPN